MHSTVTHSKHGGPSVPRTLSSPCSLIFPRGMALQNPQGSLEFPLTRRSHCFSSQRHPTAAELPSALIAQWVLEAWCLQNRTQYCFKTPPPEGENRKAREALNQKSAQHSLWDRENSGVLGIKRAFTAVAFCFLETDAHLLFFRPYVYTADALLYV